MRGSSIIAGLTGLFLLAPNAARSQPPVKIEFEVASIKRFADSQVRPENYKESGGTVRCSCTLNGLISRAYGIVRGEFPVSIDRSIQLSGPSWLTSEHYDFAAKLPEGASKQQIPAMLRQLLTERMHLSVRRESRPTPVYELIVDAGGLKMKRSQPPAETPAQSPGPPPGEGRPALPFMAISNPTSGRAHFEGRMTLARFTSLISPQMGRPVVDKTELDGEFDILLDAMFPTLTPTDDSPRDLTLPNGKTVPGDAPSIFAAIQKLGLRLEAKQGAIEYIVVEKVDKDPTEN
jgi:uncharacterized protein (TIGR03435 family)